MLSQNYFSIIKQRETFPLTLYLSESVIGGHEMKGRSGQYLPSCQSCQDHSVNTTKVHWSS